MNKFNTIVVAAIFLTSCTMIPPRFDNNEYEMFVRLNTIVEMISERCNTNEKVRVLLSGAEYEARVLATYSSYLPHNQGVNTVAKILKDDIQAMKKNYASDSFSSAYCKAKTELILEKIQLTLPVIAKELRD